MFSYLFVASHSVNYDKVNCDTIQQKAFNVVVVTYMNSLIISLEAKRSNWLLFKIDPFASELMFYSLTTAHCTLSLCIT